MSNRSLWCLIALILSPALFKFGEILVAVVVVVVSAEVVLHPTPPVHEKVVVSVGLGFGFG